MKKRWAVYTAMCTQLTDSSPAGYTHQHMHGILHQSDGSRSGVDQSQRTALTHVWSEPHQGLNKLKKRRGKQISRFRETLRGEEDRRNRVFWILRPKSFGREDTARKRSQIKTVEIGSYNVELKRPIRICK